MVDVSMIADERRYVVTALGRELMDSPDTCDCGTLSIVQGVYRCLYCHTVFGITMERSRVRKVTATKVRWTQC